jgi:hypothetical protein
MMDKERLLEGRKAIVKYREAHQELHNRHEASDEAHNALFAILCNELGELGFKDEAEFERFNKEMCLKEFRRCFKRVGVCDGCIGKPKGCVASCFQPYTKVHYADRDTPIPYEERLAGTIDAFDKSSAILYWKYNPGYVPLGCSIHFEQVAEPEFDWRWDFKNIGKYDANTNAKA